MQLPPITELVAHLPTDGLAGGNSIVASKAVRSIAWGGACYPNRREIAMRILISSPGRNSGFSARKRFMYVCRSSPVSNHLHSRNGTCAPQPVQNVASARYRKGFLR